LDRIIRCSFLLPIECLRLRVAELGLTLSAHMDLVKASLTRARILVAFA
jgi:hypothetical protein